MAGFPMRGSALIVVALALASCGTGPAPNDVSVGVGFQDMQSFEARRAALRGEPPPRMPTTIVSPVAPVSAALPPSPTPPRGTPVSVARALPPAPAPTATPLPAATDVAAVAAAAIAAVETTPRPAPPAAAPVQQPLTQTAAAPGISDEQDFDAVAGRETIESDAARIARMQAERVVIAPTAIPDRPEGIGPNIIDYALSTTHAVGERRFSRNPLGQGRHERACLAFRSADLAQEWFLQNGGPGRDRQGLDPDGDGYACAWDPSVYRAAAAAARD